MRLVYVAGPYRSSQGINGIQENINRARTVGRELWRMGFAVITPHCNTAMMDGNDLPDSVWLDGDLVMLERCDMLVVLPGWEHSSGTKGEIHHAAAHGIQTYYWPEDREALEVIAAEPPAGERWTYLTASKAARLLRRMRGASRRIVGRGLFDGEAA